jgi:hypothetical protein
LDIKNSPGIMKANGSLPDSPTGNVMYNSK